MFLKKPGGRDQNQDFKNAAFQKKKKKSVNS